MKKVLFGIAFLGAMAFSGFSTNAEAARCYQRMYWCAGELEAYNCENYATGNLCSKVYAHCYKCDAIT
ncbi:MAG TPA: hypothetical protein DEQ87_06615 [Algoriphagus sp.]|jgi:hypothetical protein|uniref:hypothetical protein n=1 Tax=unclassified Algoriphagus TaxID=2641541 RepID=UPI000C419D24|nr:MULTISPECIES: hypothetical protein [unclassified Algoriphagus]MAL12217.1 hypothetical protein [Algoriphagus sp.]QYH40900.1 hypothetical protein GYM62_19630 [Algoriphagus sp. NBT04N3]HAD52823.1 hypothetical protein [Algoriphagus sp.]HAH39011.1 hypothetical protein [Algoriphagus sp.]HAS60829.1 hypothetical protein [Algoriphagus sp.]|tara:strand:- start:1250 stop:1453 length:204 start_codon:yes stop_codon:yes gene_type:complete